MQRPLMQVGVVVSGIHSPCVRSIPGAMYVEVTPILLGIASRPAFKLLGLFHFVNSTLVYNEVATIRHSPLPITNLIQTYAIKKIEESVCFYIRNVVFAIDSSCGNI